MGQVPKCDLAILLNPLAGRGQGRDLVAGLHRRLLDAGGSCTIAVCTDRDHLRECALRHVGEGRVLAIGGGDGTIHAALSALPPGWETPLLLLPLGTENLLATHLGIRPDVEIIWRTLVAGRTAPFDVALANGRPVATVIGVGFDAQVVHRVAAERRGHITHMSYFWPIWRTFWESRFPPVRVTADGELLCDEPALVFVGNISRYAAGLRILRRARWDDGLLDLCIIRCRNQAALLERAVVTLMNRHIQRQWTTYKQVGSVCIESGEPLPVQCDGEAAGTLPLRVEVAPAAVRLLVPPGARVATPPIEETARFFRAEQEGAGSR